MTDGSPQEPRRQSARRGHIAAGDALAESTQTEGSGAEFYVGLALSLVLAAGVAALILLFWWFHTTSPCPCSGDFCMFGSPATGGADAHLRVALTGLFYGGIGLLSVAGYLVWRFRIRLRHPFLSLIVGFPVFYGGLLASTWAVARGVWGATGC